LIFFIIFEIILVYKAWMDVFNIRDAGGRLMNRCAEILFVEPDIKAVNCKKPCIKQMQPSVVSPN
jgi:hypothetical protein